MQDILYMQNTGLIENPDFVLLLNQVHNYRYWIGRQKRERHQLPFYCNESHRGNENKFVPIVA